MRVHVGRTVAIVRVEALTRLETPCTLAAPPGPQDYMDASRPPPGFMKNLKVMFDVRDVS